MGLHRDFTDVQVEIFLFLTSSDKRNFPNSRWCRSRMEEPCSLARGFPDLSTELTCYHPFMWKYFACLLQIVFLPTTCNAWFILSSSVEGIWTSLFGFWYVWPLVWKASLVHEQRNLSNKKWNVLKTKIRGPYVFKDRTQNYIELADFSLVIIFHMCICMCLQQKVHWRLCVWGWSCPNTMDASLNIKNKK